MKSNKQLLDGTVRTFAEMADFDAALDCFKTWFLKQLWEQNKAMTANPDARFTIAGCKQLFRAAFAAGDLEMEHLNIQQKR